MATRTSEKPALRPVATAPGAQNPAAAIIHRGDTVEAYRRSVERAIAHMKAHLAEPLDLDALAGIAAISKFHLVRVFDEMTGTTPHHFLACLRMQQAKELLLAPGASVTDVCLTVGYTSMGTFSKTFRELVGVPPETFRALPRRLTIRQFASAVWSYLATDHKVTGPVLEGSVENPAKQRGFIFVGTFTRGVPQGVPFSGTVMVKPGVFRIQRPSMPEFHLMAVLVPFTAKLAAMVANLPVGLVASLRVKNTGKPPLEKPRLTLRQLRATDPPILLALPALPPWKAALAGNGAMDD